MAGLRFKDIQWLPLRAGACFVLSRTIKDQLVCEPVWSATTMRERPFAIMPKLPLSGNLELLIITPRSLVQSGIVLLDSVSDLGSVFLNTLKFVISGSAWPVTTLVPYTHGGIGTHIHIITHTCTHSHIGTECYYVDTFLLNLLIGFGSEWRVMLR